MDTNVLLWGSSNILYNVYDILYSDKYLRENIYHMMIKNTMSSQCSTYKCGTVFHFMHGVEHRQELIDYAHHKGLKTCIPNGDDDIHSVKLIKPCKNRHKNKYKCYKHIIKKYRRDRSVCVMGVNEMKDKFQTHFRLNPNPPQLAAFDNGNTAVSMASYYNYPPQQGIAPTIGIISLGGTYLTADLTKYWALQGITRALPITVTVDGASNAPNQPITPSNNNASIENTLDIELASSMCVGAKIVVYFAPNTLQGFYDAIARAVYDTVNNPKVISISWGAPELAFGTSAMAAYDQLFSIGNTKGINFTVANGDNGSTDGISGGLPHCDFPSTSPHVISCGGTSKLSVGTLETVWSWNATYKWGTGGGISSYFKIPAYQNGKITYPVGTTPICGIFEW